MESPVVDRIDQIAMRGREITIVVHDPAEDVAVSAGPCNASGPAD